VINVPDIGEVRVIWSPSDLSGPDSDGHTGRSLNGVRHAIKAIVHHRVVGSLESMTNNTFYPTTDDILRAGERRVSSHFGIGFWGTESRPRIVQYVALENTAYCNGQSERDRAACDWALWLALGRPPTNEITVSIEHEDNASIDGGDGTYVVREEIIKTSIALDRLLLSGNATAIRGAGIHCSDSAAAQLGTILPTRQTLIDHHVIAPVSKPYCWRAIGDDKGFPQARYLNELAGGTGGEEGEVAIDWYPIPRPAGGQATKKADRGLVNLVTGQHTTTTDHTKTVLGGVHLVKPWSSEPGMQDGWLVRHAQQAHVMLDGVVETPPPPSSGTQDCTDEVAAAIAATKAAARIVYE